MKQEVKVYVEVAAKFNTDGQLIPTVITWEDGRKYAIDKVTDICQASAMKAGGQGDRYTIWVNNRQSYLFFERNASLAGNNIGCWFVERHMA